jgi:hypothetical protein
VYVEVLLIPAITGPRGLVGIHTGSNKGDQAFDIGDVCSPALVDLGHAGLGAARLRHTPQSNRNA